MGHLAVSPPLANSVDVSDDGTLAVVAGSGGDTSIVDLTTDTEAGVHSFGSGNNDGVAIFKARQSAYVLNTNFSSGELNLLELDISSPSNPSLRSVTLLNDPLKPGQYNSQSLRRIGDLLYVSVTGPSVENGFLTEWAIRLCNNL